MPPAEQDIRNATAPASKSGLRGWWERYKVRHRGEDELAFLPSAIEVMERPASPVARAIALTLCAFFVIALGWAYIGKIDIVAVAQG